MEGPSSSMILVCVKFTALTNTVVTCLARTEQFVWAIETPTAFSSHSNLPILN